MACGLPIHLPIWGAWKPSQAGMSCWLSCSESVAAVVQCLPASVETNSWVVVIPVPLLAPVATASVVGLAAASRARPGNFGRAPVGRQDRPASIEVTVKVPLPTRDVHNPAKKLAGAAVRSVRSSSPVPPSPRPEQGSASRCQEPPPSLDW